MSAVRPIPDALLERYLAGDLPAAERTALEARFTDADRQRLRTLEADTAAFLIQRPPGPVVAKLEKPAPKPFSWAWLAAPLAAAAALIFFVVPRGEEEVTLKGDLALAVYRQTATGSERLEPGAQLKAGDKLRFELRAPKDGFVAVLSKDGAGKVTPYYPYGGGEAAAYKSSEPLLPAAIGLDETPGREELTAFYSDKPFALAPLLKGEVPKDVTSTKVAFEKSVP